MTDEAEAPGEATLFPKTVGERLRGARLEQKLELNDIAQRTRVPLRHLQAIEDGDFSAIPTPTYAVGFARAYARAVGLDEVEIVREVRSHSEVATAARKPQYQPYDIVEPQRTPSRGVWLGAGLIALVVALAALAWFGSGLLRRDTADETPVAIAPVETPDAAAPTPAATSPTTGQVTLVARKEVWVRIYDAANTTLKMGTLAAGERYDVPTDANGPMINVGRPDELQVLVNGAPVAPLGTGRVAIKDIGISPAALAARNLPAPSGTDATAAPVATPGRTASQPSAQPAARPSPRATRSVPPFFRDSGVAATRESAAPASAGQRDFPPSEAVPATTPPSGNGR